MRCRYYSSYQHQFTDCELNCVAPTLLSPDTQEILRREQWANNGEQLLSQSTGRLSLVSSYGDSPHNTHLYGQPVRIYSVYEESQQLGLTPPLPPVQPIKPPIPTAFGAVKLLGPELHCVL